VLEVVYLIFNEGYAASSGERWVRTELCEEALRLGRILAALAPREPEAHRLIALLEIQASRLAARARLPRAHRLRAPLRDYHLLPSVRGDLLARLGRDEQAAAEFCRAAELTDNVPERSLLLRRAAETGGR
jgi:predicted RNA polymerase sigma factor